ncbi:4Fe-4S binding protein [Limisalsivibrio acetivorans]|uniref:4Fe-4S binding protein n=1 Tax=Limisalsivibrio acetivorans TaxID=1304888 RepID=UPI0003B32892|nr:4Fe-4S binding protein [Limisalsivibrio acetivorans]
MAKRPIRRWRRAVQLTVFIGMFIIPLLNIMEIYFIKGTFYSIDIGDVAMADPIAIFQAALSSRVLNGYMLASLVIPILLMFLLGRVWCSWLCPYHLLVEGIAGLKRRLGMKRDFPVNSDRLVRRTGITRFGLLIFFVGISAIAGIPLLNLISAPGVISSQALVMVKFHYVTFEIVFILVILLIEFLWVPFFWCRFVCPTGTTLSLFKSKRGMHIERIRSTCSECGSCARSCPMGLNPIKDGSNLLCHNCGECIEVCPDNKKEQTLKFIL